MYYKTDKTFKTIYNSKIVCGGSQPLAARKQPVGMLPPNPKKGFVGFESFVTKKKLCPTILK